MKKAKKRLYKDSFCKHFKSFTAARLFAGCSTIVAVLFVMLLTLQTTVFAQLRPCDSSNFFLEKEIVVDPEFPYPPGTIGDFYMPMSRCEGVYDPLLYVRTLGSNQAFPVTLICELYGRPTPDTIKIYKDTVFSFWHEEWDHVERVKEIDSYRPFDIVRAIDATGCFLNVRGTYKDKIGDGWVYNKHKKWGHLEIESGTKDTLVCDNTAVKINFQRADYLKSPARVQMLTWFYYEVNGVPDSLFTMEIPVDTNARLWAPAWVTFDNITDTTVVKLLYVKSGYEWASETQGNVNFAGDMKTDIMPYVWVNRDNICYWPDRPDSIIIYPYHQDITTTILQDTVCPQNLVDNFVGKGELSPIAIHSESERFPITGRLREIGMRGDTLEKDFEMYSSDTIITGILGTDVWRLYSTISWTDPLGCVPLPYPVPDTTISRPAASLEWKKYAGYNPDTSVCIGEEAFATLKVRGVFPIKTSFSFGKRTGGAGGVVHGGGVWEYTQHEFSWGEFTHKDSISVKDTIFHTDALPSLGAVSLAWSTTDTLTDGNGCVYYNGQQDSVSAVLVGEPNIVITSPDSSYCYLQTVPVMLHYYDSSDHLPETRKYEITYQIKNEAPQTITITKDDTVLNLTITDSTWIHFISLKSQFGCPRALADTVFLPMKSALFINLSKDSSVCMGEQAKITASITSQHNIINYWQVLLQSDTGLNQWHSIKTGDTTFIVLDSKDTRYFASVYDGAGCVQHSDTVLIHRHPLPTAKTFIPTPPMIGENAVSGRSPAICSFDTTSLHINFLTGTPPFDIIWQSDKGETDSARGLTGDTSVTIQPVNLVPFTVDAEGWANAVSDQVYYDATYYILPYIKDANGCVNSNNNAAENGSVNVIKIVDSVYDLIPWDDTNFCQTNTPTAGIPLRYRHSGFDFDIKINIHSEEGFVQDTWYKYHDHWDGISFKIPTNNDDVYRITVDSIQISPPMSYNIENGIAVIFSQLCPIRVSNSKTHVINVREYPHLVMPRDTFVCEGSEIPLRLKFDKGDAPYTVTYKEDASTQTKIFTTSDSTIIYAPDTIKRYKLLKIDNNYCSVNYTDSANTTTTINVGQTSVNTVILSRKDTTICPDAPYRLVTRTSGGAGPWAVVIKIDSGGTSTYDTLTTNADGIVNRVLDNLTADSTRYTIIEMWDKDSCAVAGTGESVIIRRRPEMRAVITSNDTFICRTESVPVNISLEGGNSLWHKAGETAWGVVIRRNNNSTTYTVRTAADTTINFTFGTNVNIAVYTTTDIERSCVNNLTDTMTVSVEQNVSAKIGNPEGVTICKDFEGGVEILTTPATHALFPWRIAYRETNLGTEMSSDGLAPGASRTDTVWVHAAGNTDTTLMFSPDTTTKYTLLGFGTEKCFYRRPAANDSICIISVAPSPAIELQGDTSICDPSEAGLRINITNGQAPYKIYYDVLQNGTITKDSAIAANRDTRITRLFNADTTTIKITGLTDYLGCEMENGGQSAKVSLFPHKRVVITTPDTFICRYETIPVRVSLAGGTPPYNFTLKQDSIEIFSGTVQNAQDTVINRNYNAGSISAYRMIISSVTDPLTGCVHTYTDTMLLSVERNTQNLWGGNSQDTICGGDTARLAINLEDSDASELLPWRIVYRTDNVIAGTSRIDTAYLSKTEDTISVNPENESKYTLLEYGTNRCNYKQANKDSVTRVLIQERPLITFFSDTEFCANQQDTISLAATRGVFPITINYKHITKNGETNYSYTSGSNTDTARLVYNMVYTDAPPWKENSYAQNKVVFVSAKSNSSRLCSYDIKDTFDYSIKNPSAKISSLLGDSICSTDTLQLHLSLTYGKTPWQPVFQAYDGYISPVISSTDTIIKFTTNKVFTYTLWELTDGDGCRGVPNNIYLRDTLRIEEYEDPIVEISGNLDTFVYAGRPVPVRLAKKAGVYPYTVKIGFTPLATGITGAPYYTVLAYSDTTVILPAENQTGFFGITEVTDGRNCKNGSTSGSALVRIYEAFSANISTGSGYKGGTAGIAGGDSTICYGEDLGLRFTFTNGVRPINVIFTDSATSTEYSFNCMQDTTVFFSAKTATNVYTVKSITDAVSEPANLGLDSTVALRLFDRPLISILDSVEICKGDTAELVFDITNGKAPYTIGYKLSSGGAYLLNTSADTTIKAVRTSSVTYTVEIIRDARGCTGIPTEDSAAAVIVRPQPVARLEGDTAVCKDETSGLKIIFTKGVGNTQGNYPYTAFLSNGQQVTAYSDTTLYATRSASQTYSLLLVKDSFGCESDIQKPNATITVWDVPLATMSGDTTICADVWAPVKISVEKGRMPFVAGYIDSKSGGKISLNISSDTTLLFKTSENITYTLTSFSDFGGCVGTTRGSATITVLDKPGIALKGDTAICKNTETPLQFTAQNGISPYIISYKNDKGYTGSFSLNQTDTTIITFSTTTTLYTVISISDGNGCISTPEKDSSAKIIVSVPPIITLRGDTTVCEDVLTPMHFTAQNGILPYTISYKDDKRHTESFILNQGDTALIAARTGTVQYTVVSITDSSGCSNTPTSKDSTAKITVYNRARVQISGDTSICSGDVATRTLHFIGGTPPYNYKYFSNRGGAWTSLTNDSINPFAQPVYETVTYTIESVTDKNNCWGKIEKSDSSVTHTAWQLPTVAMTGDTSLCKGEISGTNFFFTGDKPFTAKYQSGGTQMQITANQDTTLYAARNANITYLLTAITDTHGCVGSVDLSAFGATINVWTVPSASISKDTSVCADALTPVTLKFHTGRAPFVIDYKDSKGGKNRLNVSQDTSLVFKAIEDIAYTLTSLTDQGGCVGEFTKDSSVKITLHSEPKISLFGDTAVCKNTIIPLRFTVQSGTSPYIISYGNDKGLTDDFTLSGTDTTLTAAHNTTTLYTATEVEDKNGCISILEENNTANIIVYEQPNVTLTGDTSVCKDVLTPLRFTVQGGKAPYIISYQDNTGQTETVTIYGNDTNLVAPRSESMLYTVISMEDGSGCTGLFTGSANINVYSPMNVALKGDTSVCKNTETPLRFTIRNGIAPYTITYKDNGGKQSFMTWNRDTALASVRTVSNFYILTSITDSNGCSVKPEKDSLAKITVYELPRAILSKDTSLCQNETVPLFFNFESGTAPYAVLYRNIDGMQTTFTAYADTTIQYLATKTNRFTILTLSDSNGCAGPLEDKKQVDVNVYSLPTGRISIYNNEGCEGDNIDLNFNVTGGTAPYTITFIDDSSRTNIITTSQNDTNLPKNHFESVIYTLTNIRDNNGCAGNIDANNDKAAITIHKAIRVAFLGDTTVCEGVETPITIRFLTGEGPFYVDYNDDRGNGFSGYSEDGSAVICVEQRNENRTYTISTVYDNWNCPLPADEPAQDNTAAIEVYALPAVSLHGDTTLCKGSESELFFDFENGGTPYTVSYKDNKGDVRSFTAYQDTILAGVRNEDIVFEVTAIQSFNGCDGAITSKNKATIITRNLPAVSLSGDTVVCEGSPTNIKFNITQTTQPYTVSYKDNKGNTSSFQTPETQKTFTEERFDSIVYTVTGISDVYNCYGSVEEDSMAEIVVHSRPHITDISGDTAICGSADLPLSIAVNGGMAPYILELNGTDIVKLGGADTTLIHHETISKEYILTRSIDSNGCKGIIDKDSTVTITVWGTPPAFFEGTDTSVCRGSDVSLVFRFGAGKAPFIITYKNDRGEQSQFSTYGDTSLIFSAEQTTKYILADVIDSNGCDAEISADSTQQIIVHNTPTIQIKGDTTVCNEAAVPITFTASDAGVKSYIVYDYNGAMVSDTFIGFKTIIDSSAGLRKYILTAYSEEHGCEGIIDEDSIVLVNTFDIPAASIYGDTSVCLLSETPIRIDFAGGTKPYTITSDKYILTVSASDTTFNVAYTATDSIILKSLTDSNGCAGVIQADSIAGVNIFETPTAWIKGDTSVCEGDTAMVEMFFNKGKSPYITSINGITYTASADTILKYQISMENRFLLSSLADSNNCTGVIQADSIVKARVYEKPIASISKDTNANYGTIIPAAINIAGGASPYTISGEPFGTFTINANDTIILDIADVTHHDILKSVTEAHGCAGEISEEDSITITVSTVWATMEGDTAICVGQNIPLYFSCEGYSPWLLYLTDSTTGLQQLYTIYGKDTTVIVSPQTTTVFRIDSIQNSGGNANVLYIKQKAKATVFPIPTAVIGNDTAVCLGESANIRAEFTGTKPWTVEIQDGGGTSTKPFFYPVATKTITVTASDETIRFNSIIDSNGCRNDTISYRNKVTIKALELPHISVSGDTAVCKGIETPLGITKTAGASPLTLNGALTFYGTDTMLVAARSLSDTLRFTHIIDSNGCVSNINDSVTIKVFGTPNASIYGDTSVCPLSETPVKINLVDGTSPYILTSNKGTLTVGESDTIFNVACAVTDSIVITGLIDSNGCAGIINADSMAAVITVFETPAARIKGDTSVCFGDTALIHLFFARGVAPYTAVINGIAYTASKDTTISQKITANTKFTLQSLSDFNNCSGEILKDSIVKAAPYNLPAVAMAKDTTVCAGDDVGINISFTGKSPYQFNYILNGMQQSRQIAGDTSFTVVVNDSVLMRFLQVTDSNTCVGKPATKDSIIKITPQPLPKVTLAKDSTLCLDGVTEVPINLFVSGIAPVFTSIAKSTGGIDTLYISKDTTLIVKPTETTSYTVLCAKDRMCFNDNSKEDSTQITVTSMPKPIVSMPNDTIICADNAVNLVVNFTGTAPWTLTYKTIRADGVENTMTIPDISTTTYSTTTIPAQSITYKILSVKDAVCQDLNSGDSFKIIRNELPAAKIMGGKIYCSEAEATALTFNLTGQKPFKVTYTENGGEPNTAFGGVLNAFSGTLNVKPAATTLYAIHSIIDSNGCAAKSPFDTTTITVLPQPSVTLTKDTSICYGETVQLHIRLKNTGSPYELTTLPFGIKTVTKDTILTLTPNASETYKITQIEDANGCINDTLQNAAAAVTVWQRPTAAFDTKDTILCPEGTAIIGSTYTGAQPYKVIYNINGKDSILNNVVGGTKIMTLSPEITTDVSIKEIIDVHGCNTLSNNQNIKIIMHALPTTNIKGDSVFCAYGQSVPALINLTGTPPFTLQYRTAEGINIQDFSAQTNKADTVFVFKPEQDMSVELLHVSDKICSTSTSGKINFTVRQLPIAKILDLGQICKNDSAQLGFVFEGGTPPYKISYDINGISTEVSGISENSYNVWQSPQTSTTYTLQKISDKYCENVRFDERKTDTLTVWNRPTTVITGDTSVCEGVENARIYFPTTAYPPFTITYRDENTGTLNSKRFTSLTPTPYIDVNLDVKTTEYKLLKIEDSVCVSEIFADSGATITVIDAPEIQLLTPDTSVCRGSDFDLRFKITGGTAPYILSYLFNGEQREETGIYNEYESIPFRADSTINVVLQRVRDNTCYSRLDTMQAVKINYRVLPTANLLSTDTIICPNTSIRLMLAFAGEFPLTLTYTEGETVKTESNINKTLYGMTVAVSEAAMRYSLMKVQDAYCENTASGSVYVDIFEKPQILQEPQEIYYSDGEEIWFEMETAGDIVEYIINKNNRDIDTLNEPRFSISDSTTIDDRGYYKFIVKGVCADTYSIIVKAIYELDPSLIKQKWNNLLIMSNVPDKFVDDAYQWYKNDVPMPGNYKAFHSAGPTSNDLLDFDAWYKVRVVMVANGDTFFTRKMMPKYEESVIVFVAPNPATQGTYIDVGVGKESLSHEAVIEIFNGQGRKVGGVVVPAGENKKRIYLSGYAEGLYFFRITEGSSISEIISSSGVFLPSGLATRTLKVVVTK